MSERLSPPEAKATIQRCLAPGGSVVVSTHAEEELAKDGMSVSDCLAILRGGWVEEPEFLKGEWRYRVNTNLFVVVVAFRGANKLRVVTAWKIKK